MIEKMNFRLNNQSGAALVVAMVMIVVLTLIGLASTFTSTFESKLSGHKRESTSAFFTADSGLEAAKANSNNFDPEVTTFSEDVTGVPSALSNEPIDLVLSTPALDLPPGSNFAIPPTVVIYHCRVPGDGQQYLRSEGWIVDSSGRDQVTPIALFASNSRVREKHVIRTRPKLSEMEN